MERKDTASSASTDLDRPGGSKESESELEASIQPRDCSEGSAYSLSADLISFGSIC